MTARRALVLALACALGGCGGRTLVVRSAPAPAALVIRDVHVFDAPRAALQDGLHDVLVRDGHIAAITPAGGPAAAPVVIDGRGGTLLPGLIDLHVHTQGSPAPPWYRDLADPEENLRAFLYAGVTTVLDAASLTPRIFRLRRRVRSGRTLGPHLYAAGPMFTAPGGHPVAFFRAALPWWLRWYVLPRFVRQVGTPEEARAAVTALLPEQPDVLKIAADRVDGPPIGTEVIAAIVQAGHAAHVRSVVHVGLSADVLDAVRGGVDALLHDVYAEAISDEAVAVVAAAHIPVVPTIGVFDAIEGEARTAFLPLEREIGRPAVLTAFASVPASWDRRPFAPLVAAVRAAHAARRTNVARLRAAGVTILAGSDAANPGQFPGAALHVELGKLVEAGLSPGEALRAATVENARFLAGPEADFGEIASGKRADLLLVEGDPVARIADTMSIRAVLLDGVPLERRAPAS